MDGLNILLSKFEDFKQFLIENNFFDAKSLSELLTSDQNECENQLKLIIENIESRDQKEIERFAVAVRNSQLVSQEFLEPTDQSDSVVDLKSLLIIRLKDLLSSPKACGELLMVKKAKKIKKIDDGDIYPMKSRPRGYCVIIDNQLFSYPGLPYRTGSRADADRLSDVFSQLFFDVLRYTNKSGEQMKTLLSNLSKNTELSNHDALAVIILSHGIKDGIYGTDGDIISIDKILEYFNNENCYLLRNKPKMFFLSACRGDKIDSGVKKFQFSTTNCLGTPQLKSLSKVMPTWSDIFVYYSTIGGYASLRNTSTGSWFGYELAHSLAEFAHKEHLHDLITVKVGAKLQERETEVNGRSVKQNLETQTKGNVKKLFFNPGLSSTDK